MSKFTVDDKIAFQHQKNPRFINGQLNPQYDFGFGYRRGVNVYRNYFSIDKSTRAIYDQQIAQCKVDAKQGDLFSKGVLCGMRDAANERKAKAKKKL